ncbi:hypothetical protein VTK56DRAFT_5813 [Thermocarpiscus australiensis]
MYACTGCDKVFQTRGKRSQHERCHKKPYRCTRCEKVFSTTCELKRHLKTLIHGGGKDFQCSRCHKGYNRKDGLQNHFKKAHGELS